MNEEIVYKKIEQSDEAKVRNLINEVIQSLEKPEFFIPYEEWEFQRMFDESYAPIYGAYINNELVAMAQLYVDQTMLKEYKEILGLEAKSVCEYGGALCLKEYRRKGIMKNLMNILKEIAIRDKYDYIVTMAHPENVASNEMIQKLGLNFVKTTTVNGGFLRNVYQKPLLKTEILENDRF